MKNITIIVPYWHGQETIHRLLDSLPNDMPAIVINDAGSITPSVSRPNTRVVSLSERGYFAGACNAGMVSCSSDILILNQDVWLSDGWQSVIESNRDRCGIIGDAVMGHPAWPAGYVQGTFMFIRRDVIDRVGFFNADLYPLWGCTCEYQLRACRAGFAALPVSNVPGLHHEERHGGHRFGEAITRAIVEEPTKRRKFICTPPLVSVIVPCYNYGQYVREAVDSLMAQTLQSFEVIVVDDASTDNSGAICDKLANEWAGVKILHNKTNRGTAATINAGIAAAKGEYITVLSADDMYLPTRLEKLYQVAVDNPHSVIYDDLIWRSLSGDSIKVMREYDFDEMLYRNQMHASIFYPRQAWVEVGGYPEAMNDGREDWAFNIALGQAGYCGVHVHEPLFIYRRQGQNRSQRSSDKHLYFLEKLKRLFPKLYEGVRKMSCCGGGRRPAVQRKAVEQPAKPASGVRMSMASSGPSDETLIEYIGTNSGTETWYGAKTGQTYKFGRNPRRRLGFVKNLDLDGFLKSGKFRLAPVITPHPEPVQVVEPVKVEEAPAVEPQPAVEPSVSVEVDQAVTDTVVAEEEKEEEQQPKRRRTRKSRYSNEDYNEE